MWLSMQTILNLQKMTAVERDALAMVSTKSEHC